MAASDSVQRHRAEANDTLSFGIVTVSDTRALDDDTGGQLIVEMLTAAGQIVTERRLVKDDREQIVECVLDLCGNPDIHVVITTGGTGIARRDITFEAVTSIMNRQIHGFGELFRMLSYEEIGSAAMLSRATAGVVGSTALFSLPGSRNAIRLAMEKLLLPEIAHVVFEIRK